MSDVITKQPHMIPGYTGYCPQFRYRQGKTFGKLTHKLFLDPCIAHGPDLVLTPTNKPPNPIQFPTKRELRIVKNRERFVDSLYRNPIVGSYQGFVPNIKSKVGKNFVAAATAGVAEHERLMEVYRCERKFLKHSDVLRNERGVFVKKMGERMMSGAHYREPLIPVMPKQRAVAIDTCNYKPKKEPYSKFTVPHYMEDNDEEKYIISGYAGHVPMAKARFGSSSKELYHKALCEFSNVDRQRRRFEWCPGKGIDIGNDCPNNGHFEIYHKEIGMVPKYAGHVPGQIYKLGKSYGTATINAKGWILKHKMASKERRDYCSYCNRV